MASLWVVCIFICGVSRVCVVGRFNLLHVSSLIASLQSGRRFSCKWVVVSAVRRAVLKELQFLLQCMWIMFLFTVNNAALFLASSSNFGVSSSTMTGGRGKAWRFVFVSVKLQQKVSPVWSITNCLNDTFQAALFLFATVLWIWWGEMQNGNTRYEGHVSSHHVTSRETRSRAYHSMCFYFKTFTSESILVSFLFCAIRTCHFWRIYGRSCGAVALRNLCPFRLGLPQDLQLLSKSWGYQIFWWSTDLYIDPNGDSGWVFKYSSHEYTSDRYKWEWEDLLRWLNNT